MTSFPDRVAMGHWDDFENVEAALAPVVTELGRLPTHTELRARRLSGLSKAITRCHGGMEGVQRRASGHAPEIAESKVVHRQGFWKRFENVEAALRPHVERLGRMPTQRELRDRNDSSLSQAIDDYHGGTQEVGLRLGLAEPVSRRMRRGHWCDFANVERTLLPIIAELGRMPNDPEMNARGLSSLSEAIRREHGGFDQVRIRLGIQTPLERAPWKHWNEFQNVRAAILPIAEELGRMPTAKELHARGQGGLVSAIDQRFGGFREVEKRLGLPESPRKVRGHWQSFEHVATALAPVIAELGRMPKAKELIARGRSSASVAIVSRFGGFPAVAVRLGLGPVTDETIAAHADALARIVPSIGADPTALWTRMKRSWTTRGLDAAVAEYEADGNMERFASLLDG